MQRRFRLRHEADFETLRRQGRRWHHRLATMIVCPNGQPVSRFAFTASRRVGKATVRNRSRRLLREAVRGQRAEITPGHDLLFIARPQTAEATLAELEQAVRELVARAGLHGSDSGAAGGR
jgi:ribonuclease P protein component